MTRVSGALELRPNQVQALADLTRAFAVHDRAQLVSPCRSGKTITSASFASASEAGRVLVPPDLAGTSNRDDRSSSSGLPPETASEPERKPRSPLDRSRYPEES